VRRFSSSITSMGSAPAAATVPNQARTARMMAGGRGGADAGRSWRLAAKIANPDSPAGAQAAGIVNATTWLAALPGPGPIANRTYTRLKATHDGGRTWEWTPATLTGGFHTAISFAGSTGWGIVVDGGCRGFKTDCFTTWFLLQTLDAGSHWSRLPVT